MMRYASKPRSCGCLITAMLGLGVLTHDSNAAQGHILIPDEPSCLGCTIELQKGVVLGSLEGPGVVESDFSVAVRDADGRYYLHKGAGDSRIRVFDTDGSFLATIGQGGQGPGEYQRATAVRFSRGGEICVYDYLASRLTVLSPSFDLLRTVDLEVRPNRSVVLLPSGFTVLASVERRPETLGLPVHLLDESGRLIRSFGSESQRVHPAMPEDALMREIAPAVTGGVWLSHRSQYLMELWDLEGNRTLALERDADWFPPRPDGSNQSLLERPEPAILGLRQDAEGLIWVLIAVADDTWREQIRVTPEARHQAERIGARDQYWDTVIEAVDPSSGRVLARRQVPEFLPYFIDEELVGGVIEDGDDIFLGTWNVALKRPVAASQLRCPEHRR